ncbi:MarR family winged helix-turn-helix transcriptional regulator [Nocardia sp. NBC_01327]|uniref:MarR family winged helix-turn-helix transcriptional regulator n=1 Tax=Nocardia sp. NBC_01327 TaxID=2903593 RepID=UPI002E153333|nr:MarR family transcriptional regulator [Nocardia sp. NBC_01327]
MTATHEEDDPRLRRRTVTEVKGRMRDLRNNLALLNRQVAGRLELRDVDMDCLDTVSAAGPISPTALARATGLHPATLTGILDRLERGGWIVRERAQHDRRAVVVRALPDRNGELYQQFSTMNTAVDEICADYTTEQLQVVAEFLRRSAVAGREALEPGA